MTKCMTVITANVASHMTQQARRGKEGVFDAASDGEKQQPPSPVPHTTPTFEQHHNLHPQSTHTTRTLMPTCTRALVWAPADRLDRKCCLTKFRCPVLVCAEKLLCTVLILACTPCLQPSGHSVKSHSFYTFFIFKQATALRNPQAFAACTSSSDHESRGAESCRTTAGSGIRTR